jgi:hypothetical protein
VIDVVTKKPLRVLTAGPDVPPYIRLAYEQLDELRRVLDAHDIPYRVRENIISINGGPEMTVVYLTRGADAGAVQALLDNAR